MITRPLSGDAVEQSLYVNMGEREPGEAPLFEEWNPEIRIDENAKGIQLCLNLLSSKVGFGQQRYKFDVQSMSTAAEVKVSNKDLTESVWKQRIGVQDLLVQMIRSVLILAKEKCNLPVKSDAKITIRFDDSMFSDEEAERARDLQEVREGVQAKWEFRVKWLGESEEQAKEALRTIEAPEEEESQPELFS